MDVAALRMDSDDVVFHIEEFHYLHRWPDPRSLPFSYILEVNGALRADDGRLNGILVMKKPQHHKQRYLFGYDGFPTSWQVLDMARVWVHPQYQQLGLNMFSRFVSKALRRVQADWLEHHPPRFPHLPYEIELIISYADRRHHDGTAYRACSFEYVANRGQKDLYIKRLRPRRQSWNINRCGKHVQLTLFPFVPLQYV